jgi:hypothetical protein
MARPKRDGFSHFNRTEIEMGFLQTRDGRAGRGVREFLENLRAERVDSIRLTSASTDEPDDDDEPKKPIERRKAKAKEKPADTDDAALAAARVARDIAKAKAQGTGTRVVALSEPRTPRLEMHGQHFNRSNERELLLASHGFNSEDEFEAHAKLAAHIRDQAQAVPSDELPRVGLTGLRDQVKKNAQRGTNRPEHPGFRSFRSERNSGPFGGEGSAA